MFKNPDGKWSAVSARIRTLYDSVLKETVPHKLKASTQLKVSSGADDPSIETVNALADIENASVTVQRRSASVEQEKSPSLLPGPSGTTNSKNKS